MWGYGRNTWPHHAGAPSIDNYYLLLLLMHGVVAVGLLLTIMITMIYRLIRAEMQMPIAYPLGGSLGFTLAGIFVVYAVTIATVYMGLQAIPLFAILTGWSEAYLIHGRSQEKAACSLVVATPYQFRRAVV